MVSALSAEIGGNREIGAREIGAGVTVSGNRCRCYGFREIGAGVTVSVIEHLGLICGEC
jgi:hypothetical protein